MACQSWIAIFAIWEITLGWTSAWCFIQTANMNNAEREVPASRSDYQERRDRLLLVCTLARSIPLAWVPGPWVAVGLVAAAVWIMRR